MEHEGVWPKPQGNYRYMPDTHVNQDTPNHRSASSEQCSISVMHNHNEQFFQVGLLDRALISLGVALSSPSPSVSLDFVMLCQCFSF